jgi:hypothetical protein
VAVTVAVPPTQIASPVEEIVGKLFTVTCFVEKHNPPIVYVNTEVPAATPVTVPDDEPMVATAVLLLLHVAPRLVVLSVVVDPAHILNVPAMALGAGCTVTTTVVKHADAGSVYVIVVVPPARPTPVTMPEEDPTVATAGELLVQVPPGVVWLSADVTPGQTTVTPEIAAGVGLTVITAVV